MFETGQEFLDFINDNGGYSQLLMLTFNNSYIKVYGDNEVFDPDKEFDIDKMMFKFVEYDVKDRAFISFKSLLYIEGITMAPPGVDKDTIYYRNFRP